MALPDPTRPPHDGDMTNDTDVDASPHGNPTWQE